LNSDVSKLDNRYIITKEKFLEQYLVVDNKDKFDVIFDGLNILFFGNPSKKKLKAMGKPPTPYPRQLVAAVNHAKILGLRYLVIAKSFIETTCEDIDTMKALDAMGENIKYVDAGEEDYFSKVEDDPVVLRMAISHRAAIVSNDNFKEWFTSPKVNRLELGYGLVPYTFIHGKIEMLALRLAEHGKCPLFLMVQYLKWVWCKRTPQEVWNMTEAQIQKDFPDGTHPTAGQYTVASSSAPQGVLVNAAVNHQANEYPAAGAGPSGSHGTQHTPTRLRSAPAPHREQDNKRRKKH